MVVLVDRHRWAVGFVSFGGLWAVVWLNSCWAMVGRSASLGLWVGLWVDRCVHSGGLGGFRGGGCGCCLVGRMGVGRSTTAAC